MKSVCRACLQEIQDINYIILNTEPRSLQVVSQLVLCVPEIDLTSTKDPLLCGTCVSVLQLAYNFKNKCLRTENYIWNYKQSWKLQTQPIDIADVHSQVNDIPERIIFVDNSPDPELHSTVKIEENDVGKGLELPLVKRDEDESSYNSENESSSSSERAPEITPQLRSCSVVLEVLDENYLRELNLETNLETNDIQSPTNLNTSISDGNKKRIGKNLYKCHICKFNTVLKKELNVHKQVHTSKCVFKCIICNYGTHVRQQFKKHILKHKKVQLFCSECDFKTIHRNSLTQHLKLHTTEKTETLPSDCNCAEDQSLSRHKRSVVSNCIACNNTSTLDTLFKQPMNGQLRGIKVNAKTSKNIPILPTNACTLCNKKFTLRSNMLRHKKNCCTKLTCDMCQSTFSSKCKFMLHLKNHIF